METAPECLDCFRTQAEQTLGLTGITPREIADIMLQVEVFLADLKNHLSPPEHAEILYARLAEWSGCPDPYQQIKESGNRFAQALLPEVTQILTEAEDPLFCAIQATLAGNMIDYGAQHRFDLASILDRFRETIPVINDYDLFRRELREASSILYLADNCGEIILDGLLIEALNRPTTMVVRSRSVINDATLDDAISCGLDRICRVIGNGTGCPGTPLRNCSQELQELFGTADIVISKGQGNFETLTEVERPVYFLLTVKCPVVAAHLTELSQGKKIQLGDTIFMRFPGR
ncbi:DUF89 domain-containing protein [Thermodesulfobacteriota bacterium]